MSDYTPNKGINISASGSLTENIDYSFSSLWTQNEGGSSFSSSKISTQTECFKNASQMERLGEDGRDEVRLDEGWWNIGGLEKIV